MSGLLLVWKEEKAPDEWRDDLLVLIPRTKGYNDLWKSMTTASSVRVLGIHRNSEALVSQRLVG